MNKWKAWSILLCMSFIVQISLGNPEVSKATFNEQEDIETTSEGPLDGAEGEENPLYPGLVGDDPQQSDWYQLPPTAFEPESTNIPSAGVVQVEGGLGHTCALTTSGGVKCWGDNWEGKLGDGSVVNSFTPIDVEGLSSGVKAISSSHKHTCALTDTGGMKCWGRNWHGELGDGTTSYRIEPVDVYGLTSGVKGIAVGGFHTCALMEAGNIKCWGANWHGQVGDDTKIERHLPVDVVGLGAPAVLVAAGKYHTCAILETGALQCWGYNMYGQLGNNSTYDRPVPQDVYAMSSGIQSVSLGENHSCALDNAGQVWCWGNNYEGQLGIGNTDMQLIPVNVAGMGDGNLAIKAGMRFTCAIDPENNPKCWGENWAGQLGDESQIRSLTPVEVSELPSTIMSIGAGDSHTCVVLVTQGLMCWGSNSFGQLGNGDSAIRLQAVDVVGLTSGIVVISSGGMHSCAITTEGALKCWGNNKFGQLGNGSTIDSVTPVAVIGLEHDVTAVATGGFHTCAAFNEDVYCWGYNGFGQVGDGSRVNRWTPVPVVGIDNPASALATGSNHSCALMAESQVIKCWGQNKNGQLGNGSKIDSGGAAYVEGVDGIRFNSLTAGDRHTCASTLNGNVWCWGLNTNGQLGDGTTEIRTLPVEVLDIYKEVSSVSAGDAHTCGLTYAGEIKCWGDNIYGELGDGTTTTRLTPVLTNGLGGNAIYLEAGAAYTCAILADNTVQCWGLNQSGQLGDGTTFLRINPTYVNHLSAPLQSLGAGTATTCGITGNGGALCWGTHANGQIGDGTYPWVLSPFQVAGLILPKLSINYIEGQPGSFFTVYGENLLSEISVTFKINNDLLTPTATTDVDGNLTVILDSTMADPGSYTLTVLVGDGINLWFRLDDDAPFHPQEGSGLIYQIPSGIAMTFTAYLPFESK